MAHLTGKYRLGTLGLATCSLLLLAMSVAAEDGVPPGPGVSAPQASENAQMRAELEQLKQLVLQQQSRINALEHQQGPGPAAVGSDSLIDMLSSAGITQATAAVAQVQAPQASPQVATSQAQQNSGSSDERVRNLERRIKGLGPLSISGDVRLRGDPFFNGPRDGSLDRARASIRARLNFLADLGPQFQAGISVASGDVNNPISTSQTMGVFYTRKAFALDQAFLTYKPAEFKPLTLTGGKFRPVWFSTELTWDKDLNPEGAGETLAFPLENTPVLKRIAVVGVQLPFAEVAYNTSTTRNIVQSMMYGTQLQTNWQLMSRLRLSAYVGYYDFQNADAIATAIAKASSRNPQTPWSGSLPLNPGNTDQNSTTTTTAANVVMVNGKPVPTGVTNVTNAQFGSRFGLLDTIARLEWDTGNSKYPVTIIGDFVQNTRACANVGSIQPKPTDTSTLIFVQTTNFPCESNHRTGYWLEGRVGRLIERRDWQVGYTRIFVEREAVLSNFNYSEMLQGTNVSEHRFDTLYMFRNNVQLGFTALIGKPLGLQGRGQPWLERLQFDAIYIF